ncbi:MAG: hypothetical protein MJ252_18565 [archaeon]|nr:hypothetical protein [archaeon]
MVVNAFGSSEKGKKKYKDYKELITKTCEKIDKKLGVVGLTYNYRTVEDLDDYAYTLPEAQKNSGLKFSSCVARFDLLDIIFIDGYEKGYMPWEPKGEKLYYLIKLCEENNKIVLAQGIGMLHLIYYLATNGMTKNIINANGEFPTLENLKDIPKEFISELKEKDLFLDFVTGDYLQFDKKGKWETKGNIGIHKIQYAENFPKRGYFVLKPYHKSKNEDLISYIRNEVKINVLRQYSMHWLLKNIPSEFVAFTSLNWFLHNVCVNSNKLLYRVLADSNLGPMIIEYNTSVGTIFHLDKHNENTLNLFENFVEKYFQQIRLNLFYNKSTKPKIEKVDPIFAQYINEFQEEENGEEDKNKEIFKDKTLSALVTKSRFYKVPVRKKFEGAHCGMSYNSNHLICLENNSVIRNSIELKNKYTVTEGYNKHKLKIMANKILNLEYENCQPEKDTPLELEIEFYKKKQNEIARKLQQNKMFARSIVPKLTKEAIKETKSLYTKGENNICKTEPNIYQTILSSLKNQTKTKTEKKTTKANLTKKCKSFYEDRRKTNPKINPQINPNISKEQNKTIIEREPIISMAFPYINEDDFNLGEYYPGKNPNSKNPLIRVNLQKKPKSNYVAKFKKYEKELNTFRGTCLTCDSEYIEAEKRERREFLESKKKWMSKEDFKKAFGKSTENQRDREEYFKNLSYEENKTEGKENKTSTLGFQFRTIDKSKWISQKNFVV